MRRALLVLSFAALSTLAPAAAEASPTVSECVQVAADNVADGMSLQVENTCDFAVRCELTWSVRCEGDAAEAPARPMSLTVRLAKAAREALLASGAACGEQIWEIVDDHWECKQVK
ncbi:MAG: hypothetical protein R3B09_33750 [Nannocystaceae bacterium]